RRTVCRVRFHRIQRAVQGVRLWILPAPRDYGWWLPGAVRPENGRSGGLVALLFVVRQAVGPERGVYAVLGRGAVAGFAQFFVPRHYRRGNTPNQLRPDSQH